MTVDRPSGDLGRKLREARERKGVSLRHIANSTKIAVAVLDGLERNDISKLPGGIFGRGFVRSFATEVGLDPEAIIQEFMTQFREESVAAGHPPSEQIEDNEALERKRRLARIFFGLVAVGIPVAAVISYVGIAGRRGPSFGILRQTTTPVATEANAGPAASDAPASADVPATGAPAQPAVPDVVPPLPGKANETAASVPASDDRLVIKLAVKRACWILATVDGERMIAQVLKPGDERSLDVRNELALNIGDAGAVTMTINGVKAKPLGKSGEVVRAKLNLAKLKTYLPDR